MYSKAFIPYRGYFSSPFVRWQGKIQCEHPVPLVADTAKRWFASKNIDPAIFDYLYLGKTITQKHSFYSAQWCAALMGNPNISALYFGQACTTGCTAMNLAAWSVETGMMSCPLALTCDRVSNGPHTMWPQPMGQGGQPDIEHWVLDNFDYDPWGQMKMIETAEEVAKVTKGGVTKEECDELMVRRYEQYLESLANDREFQKGYMFPVEYAISKKKKGVVEEDEGITPCTPEGLAPLKPVIPGGVHSFGSQTHPADGNAGCIITTREKAKELSADPNVEIQIVSYGYARAPKARMGMAPVPATVMALEKAGISVKDIKAIKTHAPFIINDIYMSRELDISPWDIVNNYGCSTVYGHPQGPTAMRLTIELIEELVKIGGGYGFYTGCAAGDTGAAMVLKVTC